MSTKSRTDLKADFTTGAEINQQKFNDLIDSSLNLNDDQLNIDAGRVGIGTTSPAHKLQVNGPSMMIGGSDHKSAQLKISAQNTGGVGAWTSSILMEGYATRAQGIYFTDTGLPGKKWFAGINYFTGFDTYSIGYDADGGGLVQNREKSLLTVKGSTGNVGIGTTSPQRTLDVSNEGQITFGNKVDGHENQTGLYWHSNNDYGIYRTAGSWTANAYQQLKLRWITGIILDPGNAYDKSYVGVAGRMSIGANYSENNAPPSNGLLVEGNVGIGTTSPGATLSVVSDSENIVHLSKTSSSGGDNIFLAFSHSNNTQDSNIRAKIGTNIKNGGHGRLVFYTGSSNNTAERMRIDQEGNVGIGTTDPEEKLEVSGNIKCTQLTETSDQNLKENIQPLEQGLQALMNYKPVSYDWKKEDANKKRNYGFLAQDMQALHADTSIVSGSEQDHGLTISYTQLIPVLTKSIQELNEKLETLSHKVAGTA